MKTLQERFIEALKKQGEREVKRTNKRIVYTRSQNAVTNPLERKYYYIGKNGSLRTGNSSMSSVPCSEYFKDTLLEQA